MKGKIPYIEDPDLEAKYQEAEKLGQELKIPVPRTFLTLEVFDGKGKLIHAHRQRGHSWVRNAYNLLFCELAACAYDTANGLSLFDNGGVERTIALAFAPTIGWGSGDYGCDCRGQTAPTLTPWSMMAPGNYTADLYGIVVGSGNLAFDFGQFALQTLIANGFAAGELCYQESILPTIATVALVKTATWIRYFNNNSGGNVDVNEVGIYFKTRLAGVAADRFLMSARDVLGAPVAVPDSGQLLATCEIELTYPA